jgi:regulator of sigma E protease
MSNVPTNLFAFIIGLGFLIFIHEAGHFMVAKLFRVRVLVFSLGFGKRLFGFRRGDTDYRVSIFPLGGYVRMAGDSPDETRPGDPAEFLSKPKWQRFLILLAGPAMNLLIAIAVIAGISMHGTEETVIRPVIGEVMAGKPAEKAGLKYGDVITAINGEAIADYEDLRLAITLHANTPLRVDFLRNGVKQTTMMTPAREETDYGPIGKAGIAPLLEPVVGHVAPKSPAAIAGVQPGDVIVGMNGHPVRQFTDIDNILAPETKPGVARQVTYTGPLVTDIVRGALKLHITIPASNDPQDPYRGIYPPTVVHKLSFIPAIEDSVQQNWRMLKYAAVAVGRIFRAEGSVKELSGPVSIARISGDMFRRGWLPFVAMVAMISLQLGVMNLLPIPVLDGGHIFILLIEGLVRHDLSVVVKERIQQLGFAVLAALMIVVIYNDVVSNVIRMRNG